MCLGHFLLAWGDDNGGYFMACCLYIILGILGFVLIITTKGCIEDIPPTIPIPAIVIHKIETKEKMDIGRTNNYEGNQGTKENQAAPLSQRRLKDSDEESVDPSPSVKSAVQMEMADLGLIVSVVDQENEEDGRTENYDVPSEGDVVPYTHLIKDEEPASDKKVLEHAYTKGPTLAGDKKMHAFLENESVSEMEEL